MTAQLPHPLTRLVAVALALTAGLHFLFFQFSERIWAIRNDVPIEQITTWGRWAMADRDGAEPQFLLSLTLSVLILSGCAMKVMANLPETWLGPLVAVCFGIGLLFTTEAPPLPPDIGPASNWIAMLAALVGVMILAAFVCRAADSRVGRVSLVLLLVPICFVASTLPLHDDLASVLAPAMRLHYGFPLSQVYFQYDYLPSMIALIWLRFGGDPESFGLCTGAFFFMLLAGCFFIARRMFRQERLAALLLVSLIVMRVYAIRFDANASPQVTPIRLDLWVYPLGLSLVFGLRHWSVGLAAGAIYFVNRSFGMLYLGGYGLALAADFLARRLAVTASVRLPFWTDIRGALLEMAGSLALVAAGIAGGTLVFGGLVSDAVSTYRHLGLGMMRISSFSSFWWILPFLAVAGYLVFSQYVPSDRRSAAGLFVVALAVANLIYFFGRSHEHNLLNTSASLLFCIFLAIDRMSGTSGGPIWAKRFLPAVPWLMVAIAAVAYSGRIVPKVRAQVASIIHRAPLASPDNMGVIDCGEIAFAAKDSKVFVFSPFDYWFYQRCGYVPQGYIQPFGLEPMQARAVAELDLRLNLGYKIVVPKIYLRKSHPGDYGYNDFDFTEMESSLRGMAHSDTEHYSLYWRPGIAFLRTAREEIH